uniref:Uncharacterized protein n=1 Tax=Pelodiscus sinensis TaxID=13735 RepID=K7FLX4_PELSI
CHGDIEEEIRTSGTWIIQGPYGARYKLNIVVVPPPEVKYVGPYVIKKDLIRTVMIEPQYAVKIVMVPLHVSSGRINPECYQYVTLLLIGWNRWLQIMEQNIPPSRIKRDLVAKLMGGIGASLGTINSVNQIQMAKQLATLLQHVAALSHPIQDALLSLNHMQLDITKILPLWLELQEKDHERLIASVGYLQANLSMAIACIQAQSLWITIAKDIIRHSVSGKVPAELKPQVSDLEKDNTEWWSILDTSYDLKQEELQLAIVTLSKAHKEHIYPIIPLGLFVNHSVMMPLPDQMWTYMVNQSIKTVNLQACVEQSDLGYTCTTGLWEENHICFNSAEGECHYDLHPSDIHNNHSVVAQVQEGCGCIRSLCLMFTVNTFYIVNHTVHDNLCICNILHIRGCDVDITLFMPTRDNYNIDLHLMRKIEPIHLGPDIVTLKSLLHHPELIELVKEVKTAGIKTGIVVQHDINKIGKISKVIQSTMEKHHWWDLVIDMNNVSNTLKHPLIINCIVQLCVILYTMGLTLYACIKKSRPKLTNTVEGFASRYLP